MPTRTRLQFHRQGGEHDGSEEDVDNDSDSISEDAMVVHDDDNEPAAEFDDGEDDDNDGFDPEPDGGDGDLCNEVLFSTGCQNNK